MVQILALVMMVNFAQADINNNLDYHPIETHVVDIIYPEKQNEPLLILLSAFGRVLRLDLDSLSTENKELLNMVVGTDRRISVEFRDLGELDLLLNISEIDPAPLPEEMQRENDITEFQFEEKIEPFLRRTTDPYGLFNFMRSKNLRRNAECFHRAYLWAYDAWQELDVRTQKVFLFFTRKYIRQYNYHWWFHVSPYVNYEGNELILDATYARGPLQVQTWTNIFMANNAYCPVISAYYGWSAHYTDRYCYLRKVNMYYYHPNRVQYADRNGYQITQWDQQGLRNARAARP